MSLFTKPNQKLLTAIAWYNSLKQDEQTRLIGMLDEADSKFTSEQTSHITAITLEIVTASSAYSAAQIAGKLVELGMRDVHAIFFVSKALQKRPLVRLDAKRLLSFDDEKYEKALETVFVKFYVENNPLSYLLVYAGLTEDEFYSVLRFIRDWILFAYIRGELSGSVLREALIGDLRFPVERANKLLEMLEQNKFTIMNNYIFRNTQDSYFMLRSMSQTQAEMLAQLKELVDYLKKTLGSGQPRGQSNPYS